MTHEPSAPASTSLADCYDDTYYGRSCGGSAPYRRDEPAWLTFFGRIADRLVADLAPHSVLDAGCAMGMLVEALRDRGVEAWGVDLSPYAIGQIRADLQPYCWVGSLAQDLDRDYDLITCIEVLEHMPAEDAELAVANLTGHTDRVLFSSTPDDYQEPTHINVQPPDYWAGLFARHGFYRDLDFDAWFVSAHAVLFRRQHGVPTAVIRGYERRNYQLSLENRDLRAAQLARPNGVVESAHPATHAESVSAGETERRVLLALVGAGRRLAPAGSGRRNLLRRVVSRFVDGLDWIYARARPATRAEPVSVVAPSGEATSTHGEAVIAYGTSQPLGAINGPTPGATARVMTLLWGWAIDRASAVDVGVSAVRIYLDGVWKGTATCGIRRDDVADQFGPQFLHCGWEFALDVQGAAPGSHTVQVAAYSSVAGQEATYSQMLVIEPPSLASTATRVALFISGCPGDPKRYRCDHQAQQLQLLGITADVGVYGEVALGDVLDRYHVFVLHRVLLSADVAWFIDEVRRRGRTVVFDTDDLVFDLEAIPFIGTLDRFTERERENFLDSLARCRQALVRCDAVLVSTQPLQALASRIHPRVVVSPNVVDRSMVEHANAVLRGTPQDGPTSDQVTIAYLCGTPTHNRDFLQIADALIWALDTYPFARLLTVGPLVLDARFERFGDRVRQLPLRPWAQLAELIGDIDISLAPLEADNPFTQAKSCIKYFEAALVGVPTIASPLPDFVRVVDPGVTGLLAEGTAEWQASLGRLIESPELRRELGWRARQDVLHNHTTAAVGSALLTTLRELSPAAADDEPLTINWVVRPPRDSVSPVLGEPVCRLAGYLASRGHRVGLWIEPRVGGVECTSDAFAEAIQQFSEGAVVNAAVRRTDVRVADITIATDPTTAHLVAGLGASAYRAYFMVEGPAASATRSEQASFRLPLLGICFGQATGDAVTELTGGPVVVLAPPGKSGDADGWARCGAQLERLLLETAFVGRVVTQ